MSHDLVHLGINAVTYTWVGQVGQVLFISAGNEHANVTFFKETLLNTHAAKNSNCSFTTRGGSGFRLMFRDYNSTWGSWFLVYRKF
jgi:hypothetical protein